MKPINSIKYIQSYKTLNYIKWRFILICISILILLICLIIRITYLQLIYNKELIKKSNINSLRIHDIKSTRGMIIDRNGNPLAISIPVYDIYADPKIIYKNYKLLNNDNWQLLSHELMIPLEKIKKKIHKNKNNHFIYLARQVDQITSELIKKLHISGIYLKKNSKRYYPYGPITAHILGITNIDNIGIEGIEKSFDTLLSGKDGKSVIRKDKYGRIIEDITYFDKKISNNLTLSIDKRIQLMVYEQLIKSLKEHKAKSGTIILIDINTGEILSMVNAPSYNPNNYYNINSNMMRNIAITDMFEPGSTVKPMVIIAALHKGIINSNTIIKTTPYCIKHHKIKDVYKYNELSITGIIQKSSNIGISKIALTMPIKELITTYNKFGLGKSTNLGLIGEKKGIFPNKKTKWSQLEKATFSFGYGLMVTPLQLARVYATIGSYGIYRPLSIIKIKNPKTGIRIFPEKIIKTVIKMMESVSMPGGAGVAAAIKDYKIAIKTGTVKKIDNHGHYVNKYIAYTAGIAPASNPRIAMIIIINEPNTKNYYGGAVSAPIFGKIINYVLHLMNIKPDKINLY